MGAQVGNELGGLELGGGCPGSPAPLLAAVAPGCWKPTIPATAGRCPGGPPAPAWGQGGAGNFVNRQAGGGRTPLTQLRGAAISQRPVRLLCSSRTCVELNGFQLTASTPHTSSPATARPAPNSAAERLVTRNGTAAQRHMHSTRAPFRPRDAQPRPVLGPIAVGWGTRAERHGAQHRPSRAHAWMRGLRFHEEVSCVCGWC